LQIHQWSNETIRKVVRENWSVRGGHVNKVVDMMVTPRVIAEVRAHFNCNKLEGAELEDQGGEGTALTHWEKRILENEAMTGTRNRSRSICEIHFPGIVRWLRPYYHCLIFDLLIGLFLSHIVLRPIFISELHL